MPSLFHPSFGSPAVRQPHLTRGFASLPHDRFAVVGKGSPCLNKSPRRKCRANPAAKAAGRSRIQT